MRVNVYAEEIKNEVVLVKKTSDNGNEFIGIRFFLDSPVSLHYRDNDDDRSAVTFWVPGSKFKGYNIQDVKRMFSEALRLINQEVEEQVVNLVES